MYQKVTKEIDFFHPPKYFQQAAPLELINLLELISTNRPSRWDF
jgi:hypothetical protein